MTHRQNGIVTQKKSVKRMMQILDDGVGLSEQTVNMDSFLHNSHSFNNVSNLYSARSFRGAALSFRNDKYDPKII